MKPFELNRYSIALIWKTSLLQHDPAGKRPCPYYIKEPVTLAPSVGFFHSCNYLVQARLDACYWFTATFAWSKTVGSRIAGTASFWCHTWLAFAVLKYHAQLEIQHDSTATINTRA